MDKKKIRSQAKKIWHFIWEDDSVWSWIANIIIAFILIKFLVYPVLGFGFGTTHPIVAVISDSMHHETGFEDWWDQKKYEYEEFGITKSDFEDYPMKNGFNRGDIIFLRSPKNIKKGDILVFWSMRPDPIIHRVVDIRSDSEPAYQTKGDNNPSSLVKYYNPISKQYAFEKREGWIEIIDETDIQKEELVGKTLLRVPYLGYIKIWFVEYLFDPVFRPLMCFIYDFNFCTG